MELESDYYLAWAIYLLAVLTAQIVVWRLVLHVRFVELRSILQVCSLALFITPVRLDPTQNYWVPAFIAALMDGLNDGVDALLNRFVPVLFVMTGLLIASFILKLIMRKNKSR